MNLTHIAYEPFWESSADQPFLHLIRMLLAILAAAFAANAFAGETYEGTYSASFPNQVQSCGAAQDQAERAVRDHFRRQVNDGAGLSISDKRCECSKNTRFASPLYDCLGYATGSLEERAAFDDSNCSSILSSGVGPDTWTLRMSRYLTCVRRLPDYNRSWDAYAMQRVREQQQSESN